MQCTTQKMKYFINDFLKLRIWLHLLKKSLMENFIFCTLMLVFNYLPKPMDARYNQEKKW